jgi:hypothetical protein
MIENKVDFLKKFLPESVREIDYTQINLDITDLSFSDILRNLNKLYPPNSKNRNAIESGEMALGVLCKSETLEPYSGVFLLVCQKDLEVNIVSRNYIVLCISEQRIRTEVSLMDLMDDITGYLIKNYYEIMRNLPDFYRKFVYNETELYEDDYTSSGY